MKIQVSKHGYSSSIVSVLVSVVEKVPPLGGPVVADVPS